MVSKGQNRDWRKSSIDLKNIRKRLGMTQTHFAAAIGIRVGILRNREQGHQTPTGPVRVLLQGVDKHPETILEPIRPAD